jgi:hypothetical protein
MYYRSFSRFVLRKSKARGEYQTYGSSKQNTEQSGRAPYRARRWYVTVAQDAASALHQVRRHPRYLVNWLVTLSILLSLVTISPGPSAKAGVPTDRNSIPEAPLAPAETGTPTQTGTAITLPTATSTSSSSTSTSTSTSLATSTRTTTSIPGTPSASVSPTITHIIATNTPPPTYTIGVPTAPPTLTPIPDTNYVDQAIEQARASLLAEINALPSLTGTITGTLVSPLTGARITSPDGSLTLGLRPGMVALTDTMVVRIEPGTYQVGDPRRTRNGQPLAYNFELTATRLSDGQPITGFSKEAVLIWNLNYQTLGAAGVYGFPLHAYTFNEQGGYWQRVRSEWNPQTNQLIAYTPHFSSYAVGGGFDAINNYLPSVKDFEVDLQSGSATSNYSMELPSGPGGFAPKLSLTYNSGNVDRVDAANQGSSPVGWGWNLGGISYIAATQSFFGSTVQPWTASIVLDGVSGDLVKAPGPTASPVPGDGLWHSSNESYAKIQYEQGSGTNTRTDDKWTVWTKDGTKYEFDINATKQDNAPNHTGMTTYKWLLSKATDVHGNTITFKYRFYLSNNTTLDIENQSDEGANRTNRANAVYPLQIKYGGVDANQSSQSKVLVQFNLASRSDISESDEASGLYQTQRITSIDVKRLKVLSEGGGYVTLRSYEFEQNYNIVLPILGSPTTTPCPNFECPHLTLAGITRKSGDNGNNQQLPKTTFEYVRTGVCDSQGPSTYDKGKLCTASNGYGGTVVYGITPI